MKETMRQVRTEDFEALNRFLEYSYGHGRGFFLRHYPDLYRKEDAALEGCLIVEKHGSIVSHVGTFPIELKIGPARLLCGGIGGVATADAERGHGYMSQLMNRSMERMEEKGMSLSVLWGDRQRYSHFGYETCGTVLNLQVSQRSLAYHDIAPALVEEVDPAAPATVRALEEMYAGLDYGSLRPDFPHKLCRIGLRVFLGSEGYLISRGYTCGDLSVLEVVSPPGKEPEIVAGALRLSRGTRATIRTDSAGDERGAGRLISTAASWSTTPQGMFRIIDWPALLNNLAPVLSINASGLPPFRTAVGCRFADNLQTATIEWDGQDIGIGAGKKDAKYIECDSRVLAGMLFGGPRSTGSTGSMRRILPAPIHIPELDHV